MRHSIHATALVLLLLAAAPPVMATDGPLDHLAGEYTFVGGAAEREAIDRAVEHVVDRMPFFVRDIARGRIHEQVRPERRVAVAVRRDGQVQVQLDHWTSPSMLPGAPARAVTGPDGAPIRFSMQLRGERLEMVGRTAEGSRESWLSGSEDGRYLFLQVRIGSPQLPETIRYTLSYRAAAPRLAAHHGSSE